eukprot:11143924-Lingulodinium_polyedra.AAC.1
MFCDAPRVEANPPVSSGSFGSARPDHAFTDMAPEFSKPVLRILAGHVWDVPEFLRAGDQRCVVAVHFCFLQAGAIPSGRASERARERFVAALDPAIRVYRMACSLYESGGPPAKLEQPPMPFSVGTRRRVPH